MYLIADGGSTKIDWVIIKSNNIETHFNSKGLNPSILTEAKIEKQLNDIDEFKQIKSLIQNVYFYGAGCGSFENKNILKKKFECFFNKAKIIVKEDTNAAIYATSNNKPSIVSILGTGSNTSHYNGSEVINQVPSLGYTVMDEASGNYFGKILLRDYFYKKMPIKIRNSFESKYNLDINIIKDNLYKQNYPNMYLASFSKFMFELKDNLYIRNIIISGFEIFIENKIKTIENHNKYPLHFVGSIAYYYKDILIEVLNKYDLKIGSIIQKPINGLVKYHND